MKKRTPDKLFVCLLKSEDGWDETLASVGKEHSRYMTDLWQRGIFWAGGPTAEKISIEIYAVDSIEEAMKAQRNAPLYLKGYLHDDKYLEWCPSHWPPLHPDIDPNSGKRTGH
jgi:uncharacterized protein YciI